MSCSFTRYDIVILYNMFIIKLTLLFILMIIDQQTVCLKIRDI